MLRIVAFAALTAALAACGASAASIKPQRIMFGLTGGSIAPWQVTIEPTGRVRASGVMRPRRRRLSPAEVVTLSRRVRQDFRAGARSRLCAGTNPDVASDFVRAFGRTVRVHGSCEPRFHRLWNTLAQAAGLRFG